ncbi:GNAT family N-acetyltransferase [Leucobacter sp. M11]|uniref:GNAT family N-acetyltransferase n=1 Tax=Leucobacter sp. M11 TaxID=2993565 RepID=UPI002D803C52|nr:GNAT family N-acetyltransferase [Leucobacter sp. M11]MEB4616501.1 GNAT family N-acetyltransferase [Leucobacter sp. M11]
MTASPTPVSVRQATVDDLDALTPLFDAYRQFYLLPSDPELARGYLADRIGNGESTVFLALDGDAVIGFTQLYPAFNSLDATRCYVLYDLFVDPNARRSGAGRALLNRAAEFGRERGATQLELFTAHTNTRAQALYESQGWQQDHEFRSYVLRLDA